MKAMPEPPLSTVQRFLGRLREPSASSRGAVRLDDAVFLAKAIESGENPLAIANETSGATLLILAAELNGVACLKLLLPISDAKATLFDGSNALFCAAAAGHAECVALLAGPCDPSAVNRAGETPLVAAVRAASLPCVEALLPFGGIDRLTQRGKSALMIAAEQNNASLVRLLLQNGANPNLDGAHGLNALMWAASASALDAVEALLPGTDLSSRSQYGRTAFELAAERDDWSCMDLLASRSDAKAVELAFLDGGAERMPRWAALRERCVLAAEAGLPGPPESEADEAPPSPLARTPRTRL